MRRLLIFCLFVGCASAMLWSRNLQGYWPLEGTANDASGNGRHATLVNGSYVAGKFGQGISITADNQWLQLVASDVVLPSPASFTVTAWAKTTSTGVSKYIFATRRAVANSYFTFNAQSGYTRLVYPSGTGVGLVTGTKVINDGEWHFYCAVKDGTSNYLYVDLVLDASATAAYSISPSADNAAFGGFDGMQFAFAGSLDELAVWSRVLSLRDMKRVMMGLAPVE